MTSLLRAGQWQWFVQSALAQHHCQGGLRGTGLEQDGAHMEVGMFLCPPLAELRRAAQEQVVLWDSNSLKHTLLERGSHQGTAAAGHQHKAGKREGSSAAREQ